MPRTAHSTSGRPPEEEAKMPAAQRDVRQRDIGQNPPEGLVCARRGGQAVALPGPAGKHLLELQNCPAPHSDVIFPQVS